jgi:hypothetical protein
VSCLRMCSVARAASVQLTIDTQCPRTFEPKVAAGSKMSELMTLAE